MKNSPDVLPDKPGNDSFSSQIQKLLTVLLGTYAFILVGCGSLYMEKRGEITFATVAAAWGAVVSTNIYTFGHISGAHINPALTFAYAVAGQFPWKQVPFYVMAELFGTTIACLTLQWLFNEIDAEVMLTQPVGPNPVSDGKVVLLEIIITFIYTMSNCGSRTDPRAFKELGGLAAGVTLSLLALVAGKITGASMNPARSLGPAIVTLNFHKIWIYIISPVIGAVSATTLYFFYLMPQKSNDSSKQEGKSFDSGTMKVFTNDSMGVSMVSTQLEGKSMEMV